MTAMAGGFVRQRQLAIERASPSDRAFLAMDSGEVPEQFGVILMLDKGGELDLERARRLLAERVPAVPRLRQRLVKVPLGCGGPIWVDDPGFDIRRHVRAVACHEPGDEPALLDTALSVVMSPLPRTAPLWSAVLVTGPAGNTLALVIVLHHALANGVGGLAVLAQLIDGPSHAPEVCFPRPAPAPGGLARDAFAAKVGALRHAPQSWRLLRVSMGAGGGLRPPRSAPSSLNQPTGPRRQLAVVRADLAALRAAAHRHGATTNNAVLVAVAGALHQVLVTRGEPLGTLLMTVPVSGRRPDGEPALGNMVSPMLVSVPATGGVPDRLRRVTAQVRAHKEAATGPPPIALLGWLFRPLAALGGFRWYMDHQHRFHTLVSHVRGPAEPVTFGGCPITSAISAGVGPGGNIPVYFEVLSYAGTLTVTAIADPDHFPELDTLTDALRAELDVIVDRSRHGAANDPPIMQHRSPEHAGTGRRRNRRDPGGASAADGPNVRRPHIVRGAGVMSGGEPVTEVADGVYCVGVGRGALASNVYLIRSGASWALVDAAWPGRGQLITAAAESVFGEGTRPASMLLTHIHPDHSGSARELARFWDLPVWVHPGEMPMAAGTYRPEYGNPLDRRLIVPLMRVLPRRRVDSMISDASLAGVARPLDPVGPPPGLPDWRCVAAPGHTPGHVAFFRAGDRVLIAGDAVLTVNLNSVRALLPGRPGAWGPPRYTTWNWPLAKESVAALARLEPLVLAGGHGRPMTGAGTAACLHALTEKLSGGTGAAGPGRQRHPAARTADRGPHRAPGR